MFVYKTDIRCQTLMKKPNHFTYQKKKKIRCQTQQIRTEMNGTIAFSLLRSQVVFDMLAHMCLAWVNSEAKHQGGILVTITSLEMFIS